jgi:hypothetical protein
MRKRHRGTPDHDTSRCSVRLKLIRMEDRVLLDAAGLAVKLPLITAGAVDAFAQLEAPPSDATSDTAAAALIQAAAPTPFDSVLQIDAQRLVFEELHPGRDNQLLISIVASQLHIRDAGGFTIDTSIAGAVGGGTSAVSVPLSSLTGVNGWFMNLGDGNNSVTFDLSRSADVLLAQFPTVRLEGAEGVSQPSSVDLQFIGDRTTNLRYLQASGRDPNAIVEIRGAGHSSSFRFDQLFNVDVTGMKLAEFVGSGVNQQRLSLSEGLDAGGQGRDALKVEFSVPRAGSQSVQFFSNETMIVHSAGIRGASTQIAVQSLLNNHQNHNLVLDTVPITPRTAGHIDIQGSLEVAGDLAMRTRTISIQAPVLAQGQIDIAAERDVQLVGQASVQGLAIQISSASGQIFNSSASSSAIAGQQVSLTSARGVGTRIQPVRTRAQFLMVNVTGEGGIFVDEFDSLVLTAASTVNGSIEIRAGGSLTVASGIIGSAGRNIDLTAADDVILPNGGSIEIDRGTITLRPDDDLLGGGRLIVNGTILNHGGTTQLWVPSESSVLAGVISGTGSVTKLGSGVLTIGVAGHLAHSGTTLIQQGVLVVDGRITHSSLVTLADNTTLQGRGMVAAPVFSKSASSQIVVTGPLRLGDGTSAGLDFAGTLSVQPGQTLTIHDADLANLGQRTELRGNAVIVAAGGLQVDHGEQLIGTGRLQASLVVRSGGLLGPGFPLGSLQVVDLTLEPGAILDFEINGTRPGTYDQLVVAGPTIIDGAVLQLRLGQFNAAPGTVFTLIANSGSATIEGLFVDVQGTLLPHGTKLQVGGLQATLSYVGATQLNILELTTASPQFFIPVRVGGDTFLTLFIPSQTSFQIRPEPASLPVVRGMTEATAASRVATDRVIRASDTTLMGDVRLFFRIFDDSLMIEMDQQFDLDPAFLANLPSLFETYRFPDGHYRIYLQEAGSEQVRLVLDVHIYEGNVVPENYREAEPPFASEPVQHDQQAQPTTDVPNEAEQASPEQVVPNSDKDAPPPTPSIQSPLGRGDAAIPPDASALLSASARLLRKWCR